MSGEFQKREGLEEETLLDVKALGKGYELASRKDVNLTWDEARRFITMTEFAGDRKLRPSHVEYLLHAMQRGTFRPELVTLIVCECKGKTYRMNGQHTCWARLEMDEDYTCPVAVLTYRAKTEADMRLLYATIDRGAARTRSNVLDSHLVGTALFEGVPNTVVRLIAAGFTLWKWVDRSARGRHDGDDVSYLLLTEHAGEAELVSDFLRTLPPRESRHVLRGPVVAAMFATFALGPRKAKEFWVPVADGVNIGSSNDPRMRLRNLLVDLSAIGAKPSGGQEHLYRLCIVAWNAFRSKTDVRTLKAPEDGDRPEVAD